MRLEPRRGAQRLDPDNTLEGIVERLARVKYETDRDSFHRRSAAALRQLEDAQEATYVAVSRGLVFPGRFGRPSPARRCYMAFRKLWEEAPQWAQERVNSVSEVERVVIEAERLHRMLASMRAR